MKRRERKMEERGKRGKRERKSKNVVIVRWERRGSE